MAADPVRLTATEAALVDLAVLRYEDAVAQAQRALEAAVAPIRAERELARMELSRDTDGHWVIVPNEDDAILAAMMESAD